MRIVIASVCLFVLAACGTPESSSSHLAAYGKGGSDDYPKNPDQKLTPGQLCDDPDYLRHPEKVPYCERNVDSSTKAAVIRTYDRELGYHVGAMNRQDFKIDHFIPLCIGGGNDDANLWPQHKTVYVLTDRIEDQLCQLMQRALMKQAEAVEVIRYVKFNLDEAAKVQRDLDDRLH